MRILVIEDDGETASFIKGGLTEAGHVVDAAATGSEGLYLAGEGSYDVMVIDRMLPGPDGIAIVKTLRAIGVRTPMLILSTLDGVDDRVTGLDAGADDYLVKPFAFAELTARLQALRRRPALVDAPALLKAGDLELDPQARTTSRAGRPIELQAREFRLLEYLMRHAGQTVTRSMLLEQVWDFHFDPRTTVVETHISRLRGKIDRGASVELIETVRGVGYRIRSPA